MPRTVTRRRRSQGLGTTAAIVLAIHGAMGGGLLWLATTQAGQEFARIHKITFFEPEAEKEQPQVPDPVIPPTPPPRAAIEAPPELEVAAPAPSAARAEVAAVGGGGPGWGGGRFAGGFEEGPLGAFHASVTGRVRSCLNGWPGPSKRTEIELRIARDGAVRRVAITHPSGVGEDDAHVEEVARCVQEKGVGTPPEGKGRAVTVRLIPSSGGLRVEG